ncbi:MAG: N-6 DNA methylase [Euzebya sp.]
MLKVLYESVIGADQRKQMGEYYTPDWLAQRVVDEVVTDPLQQRVLDPACGSGTFVFHAIRKHLAAAEDAGMDLTASIDSVTSHVMGLEVHPVAVAFARVTYLLAIGTDRLTDPTRPAMTVPVYLGDSLQRGQHANLFTANALTIQTDQDQQLFTELLTFPEKTMEDVGRFDELVEELSVAATNRGRGSAVPSLAGVFARYGLHPDDQTIITATFAVMCKLHDEDRDHIWGYYVRNLARPAWLARPDNRVDVLIGNPPWLAYRFMTEDQQADFRQMSEDRNLWAGASVATNQDLSTLFLVRAAELYLKRDGRFAMVLPEATLSRTQYTGFRAGRYNILRFAFDHAWELHDVKPDFFPVPGAVVTGQRAAQLQALEGPTHTVSGRLLGVNVDWEAAKDKLSFAGAAPMVPLGDESLYASRFS